MCVTENEIQHFPEVPRCHLNESCIALQIAKLQGKAVDNLPDAQSLILQSKILNGERTCSSIHDVVCLKRLSTKWEQVKVMDKLKKCSCGTFIIMFAMHFVHFYIKFGPIHWKNESYTAQLC